MGSSISGISLTKYPDREQPFLHSPKLLETLRALEKELRAYIPTSAETGADADDATP